MEVLLLLMATSWLTLAYTPTSAAQPHLESPSSSSSISSSSFSPSRASPSQLLVHRDVTFSPNRLDELGSRGQWLLRHIALMTHTCGVGDMASMRRKLLRKSDVTCNDGSYAGFLTRNAMQKIYFHADRTLEEDYES
ncbi:hypothetical protein RRG08_002728 [Elysia crispata]|uniref:Uncharacterized protein n=1 Tax=Elysia crispata TaxID=231223 RepID=A0AAE0XTY7_9GAST|nr:hypothetical protein RRG08_002728 [Elysia crispata]